MSNERQALVDNVDHYVKQLNAAVAELDRWDSLPDNHKYRTLAAAEGHLKDWLCDKAHADCERRGEAGQNQYTQEFSVAGKRYRAVLVVEYNRHDKTYYYVDGTEFSVIEL